MVSTKQFLEWHGQQWRVVVKVPVRLRTIVGRTKLKHPLHTEDLKVANTRKWAVVERMKGILAEAERALTTKDPIDAEAMLLRLSNDDDDSKQYWLGVRAEQIETKHGHERAKAFADLASGRSTPLDHHLDAFIAYKATYSLGAQQDFRRVMDWLGHWLKDSQMSEAIEAVTRQAAGRFIDESLSVGRGRDKAAAYLGFLREHWRWLKQRGHTLDNPWVDQELAARPRAHRDAEPDTGKRPFTDTELATLAYGPASSRLLDLMHLSALSGMRVEEICQLRIEDCLGGLFAIREGKTANAKRQVPIHSKLKAIVERRSKGKELTGYLIEDLPVVPKSRESRSDPATKEFTRYRRKMNVDERPNGKAKSNVDFHSFRRWFMRKARDAMHAGTTGFDERTLVWVVGHVDSSRDKTLDLSQMGYAGPDPVEAKRALVEAVKLPSEKLAATVEKQ